MQYQPRVTKNYYPQPDTLEAASLELLVYAAGGAVENGVALGAGSAPRWATAALAACAVLSADRSVARGSSREYFTAAFRRLRSAEPDTGRLAAAGVIARTGGRLLLTPAWRAVWRLALVLADTGPLSLLELASEYANRYEEPESESEYDHTNRYKKILW